MEGTERITLEGGEAASLGAAGLTRAAQRLRERAHVLRDDTTGRVGVAFGGTVASGPRKGTGHDPSWSLLGSLPPIYPEWLGDRSFLEIHDLRFPYVSGAMANGIATTRLVIAMAQAGMLGFFGAAGLSIERVSCALDELHAALGPAGLPWGSNLIHSPQEPELEAAIVALYLERGVRRVSASAYMGLTAPVVRYAASGLTRGPSGEVLRTNHLFAKVSRPEVARRFLAPAPKDLLHRLVAQGQLTAQEAALSQEVPLAEDLIVEADSGGHTDRQTLGALFPTLAAERDRAMERHGYKRPIRLGAAGGLGEPTSVAAAFGLGAAFVLTGSVNQATLESGLSITGRELLAQASLGDVMMAPAADMFEMGVKVQVLKRGTLFAMRGAKLYEAYCRFEGLDAIEPEIRARFEREIFGGPLEEVWEGTRAYWAERDPREVARAEREPKHQMALCFRWYLGMASRWAIEGLEERRTDYQIWCGPAMGAFNAWSAGSFLANPDERGAVQVALNLLEGAASITRAHQLRSCGVPMPSAAFTFAPRRLA